MSARMLFCIVVAGTMLTIEANAQSSGLQEPAPAPIPLGDAARGLQLQEPAPAPIPLGDAARGLQLQEPAPAPIPLGDAARGLQLQEPELAPNSGLGDTARAPQPQAQATPNSNRAVHDCSDPLKIETLEHFEYCAQNLPKFDTRR